MTSLSKNISREDVLASFSVEPEFGRATLERYLLQYPEYGEALIDLSYELGLTYEDGRPLSAHDNARIDAAWLRHASQTSAVDVLASLTPNRLRAIANALGVPRQVLTAFRERAVVFSSVPRAFLVRFSSELGASFEALSNSLMSPPASALARSFKADGRPTPPEQVSFERILIDAGVTEEDRIRLLSDTD